MDISPMFWLLYFIFYWALTHRPSTTWRLGFWNTWSWRASTVSWRNTHRHLKVKVFLCSYAILHYLCWVVERGKWHDIREQSYRKYPNTGEKEGNFVQIENRIIFGWDMAKIVQKPSRLRAKGGRLYGEWQIYWRIYGNLWRRVVEFKGGLILGWKTDLSYIKGQWPCFIYLSQAYICKRHTHVLIQALPLSNAYTKSANACIHFAKSSRRILLLKVVCKYIIGIAGTIIFVLV